MYQLHTDTLVLQIEDPPNSVPQVLSPCPWPCTAIPHVLSPIFAPLGPSPQRPSMHPPRPCPLFPAAAVELLPHPSPSLIFVSSSNFAINSFHRSPSSDFPAIDSSMHQNTRFPNREKSNTNSQCTRSPDCRKRKALRPSVEQVVSAALYRCHTPPKSAATPSPRIT